MDNEEITDSLENSSISSVSTDIIETPESDDKYNKIKNLMGVEYEYPNQEDENFQYKIYKKREFYINRIPEKPLIKDYNDIKEYRDDICGREEFKLNEHQILLSNFINPNTPYMGLLLFHGMGTGKCTSADTIVYVNNKLYRQDELWNNFSSIIINDNENGLWSKPKERLIVKSFNTETKLLVDMEIDYLYCEYFKGFIKQITFSNGRQIKISCSHKLLSSFGWTNNLTKGMLILCVFNNTVYLDSINNVEYVYYDNYIYDLEIEQYHNYVANNIICHNTCAAISVAEKFKSQVQKYGTKIHILVPGPIIRESWKRQLVECTGETYIKYQDKTTILSEEEKKSLYKQALSEILQFYRIMSYKSFYKRVLGEKIQDKKVISGKKTKIVYRKTDEGEFERDISIDRIYDLNNSLIIVDEAHGLTDNQYGDALKTIIKKSINLRVLLLTGTPMKNKADDIIELINFIRPQGSPMLREKIFEGDSNHLMKIKEDGLDYFKNMTNGYISHVRGGDPLIFAKRVDKGIIPKYLSFTKIIPCFMLPFQQKTYDIYVKTVKSTEDALDRMSQSLSNFIFPILDPNKTKIVGAYGLDGIKILKEQLRVNANIINKKLCENILKIEPNNEMIYLSSDDKTISGKIFMKEYLKNFSIKFYKALLKLERLVEDNKGVKTAFIYSNLVKVGINLFQEVLLQNGYLEFDEHSNYKLQPETICYRCGKQMKNHTNKHEFKPATFITITGRSSEETAEYIPEEKENILNKYFNDIENVDGKYIKFVLGSRVINEGVNLLNVGEVHILDAHFNFGRVDQVVARAIRHCSHYKVMNKKNPFPKVELYKYSIMLKDEPSTEIDLYKKAEMKYVLIKKVERAMKEVAIDCPLNINGNIFEDEIKKYENCVGPEEEGLKCPMMCDYTKCVFNCHDKKLNAEFYDPTKKIYKKIPKHELDYSTFTQDFAINEINYAKDKIKEIFLFKYVYKLNEILEYVKMSYNKEKRDLFDDFFVYKALDDLIPVTENDFNNFKDTIVDKYNEPGYIIYINNYYIFQPFNQNKNVTMYYRTTFNKTFKQSLGLYNYLKNNLEYKKLKTPIKEEVDLQTVCYYDYDSTLSYYDNRNEFDYVGIIDCNISKKHYQTANDINDTFKIREKRTTTAKKRGIGIQTFKGAICDIAKNKEYLQKLSKRLGIDIDELKTRTDICNKIKDVMLDMEKYATGNNKLTYVMIPFNHPIYPFPYNLEDRIEYITNKLKEIDKDIKYSIVKSKGKVITYKIIVKQNKNLNDDNELINKYNAIKDEDNYVFEIK